MGAVIVLSLILIAIIVVFFYKKGPGKYALPKDYEKILLENVAFYRSLRDEEKLRFDNKIKEFLASVRITGINTNVEDIDRLLVASSAIIPIFGFPNWQYYYLNEVLLYPSTFDKETFLAEGNRRDTLGMIGNGPMQRVMILSKPALHAGFQNKEGTENTGIHEFVHLLDKEDGYVDGLPQALMKRKYAIPWLELINENIKSILEGKSDINVYGATNRAEFFAVASEYFFTQPELFKEKHEDLYNIMSEIFRQKPTVSSKRDIN